MKKLIIAITLSFCGLTAFSQIYVPVNPTTYGENQNRIRPLIVLHIPEKNDTITGTTDTTAQIFLLKSDSSVWAYYKQRGFFRIGDGGGSSNGLDSIYVAGLIDTFPAPNGKRGIIVPISILDSLKHQFIDTGSSMTDGYVLTWDGINRKWVLGAGGGGGGGVQSVTGTTVDNTDPINPIVNVPSLEQVATVGNTSTRPIIVNPSGNIGASLVFDGAGGALELENVNAKAVDIKASFVDTSYKIELPKGQILNSTHFMPFTVNGNAADSMGRITISTGSGITALTGDVTASGSGSVAATLPTVNSNVGSFTNASLTVNAKGLITAASNGSAAGVTNIATGYGLSGGPITATGTIVVDSAVLSTKYLRLNDSTIASRVTVNTTAIAARPSKAQIPFIINHSDTISRRWNVLDYGADNTGVVDATTSIQNAINACDAAGGGEVLFPVGTYLISGSLQASNSQLFIPPSVITSASRNHITLRGESKPNLVPVGGGLAFGAALPIASGTVILKSTLTSGATGAAVIGTALGTGSIINETFLSVENISIQVKNSPSATGPVIGGISYKNGGGLTCKYVAVYIDTSGYRSTLPTNDVTGIETPDNSAESFNNLENTLCIGFRSGYKIGEHVVLSQANAWCCFYGFYIKQSYHNLTAMRAVSHWCPYDIYVRDFCTLANFNIDIEWQQIGKWYDNVTTFVDTANVSKGQLFYTIIAAGVGVDNTKFAKSGGTNIYTLGHAEGVMSATGLTINQNAMTNLYVRNSTSGTAARSVLGTVSNGNVGVYLQSFSSAYTTSGMQIPNTASLTSDMSAGLNIGTNAGTQLSFYTNSTERARFLNTGQFLVGGSSLIGAEYLSIQKNQNANTFAHISNTTAGTNGRTGLWITGPSTVGLFFNVFNASYTNNGMNIASTANIVSDQSAGFNIATIANTALSFYTNSGLRAKFLNTGALQFSAGTANAGTEPMQFTAGVVNTTPVSGVTETDATNNKFYTNSSGVRAREAMWNISSTAVDYTATDGNYTILISVTGKTVTLPTAVGISGRVYIVKLTVSGSGTVATTSSQTIDGSTTYSLSAQYKYVMVQSDNANWNIIGNN